jgi:hypothetical protein
MGDRDFTFKMYKKLVLEFKNQHYTTISFSDYLEQHPVEKLVILRHDVDKNPENALKCAEIERENNMRSTYYFRIVKESFNPDIIRKIEAMGHEIGYHYEDLALANGDMEKAIKLFADHLAILRKMATIKTICMHGNPLSRWDNLLMWKKYSYREFNITGEPFLDLDFNLIYYLTDTGRRWDAYKYNVRDKVETSFHFPIRKTPDLINHLKTDLLPAVIMLNMHPQRWNDSYFRWVKELIWQNAKNQVKRFFSEQS